MITKITSKNDLSTVLTDNANAVNRLDEDKKDEFKKNFLELWNNKYLIGQANPTELLDFCIQVTNIGISVNPWHKQVSVLPFTEKGQQGKKLEAVYSKDGIQEMAFNAGFQMEMDTIWSINGSDVKSKDLPLGERARLDMNDNEFVTNNFLGFYFELIDLNGKLHNQNNVIGVDYCKLVTKSKPDKSYEIANWQHKAFRKAYDLFFIPKNRDNRDVLSRLDNLNNTVIDVKVEETPKVEQTKDSLKIADASTPTVEETPTVEITVNDINRYYNQNPDKHQAMAKIFADNQDWRKFNAEQLSKLLEDLKK